MTSKGKFYRDRMNKTGHIKCQSFDHRITKSCDIRNNVFDQSSLLSDFPKNNNSNISKISKNKRNYSYQVPDNYNTNKRNTINCTTARKNFFKTERPFLINKEKNTK